MIIESKDTIFEYVILGTRCEEQAPDIVRERYHCKHCGSEETLFTLAGCSESIALDNKTQARTVMTESVPQIFTSPETIDDNTIRAATCKRCQLQPQTIAIREC